MWDPVVRQFHSRTTFSSTSVPSSPIYRRPPWLEDEAQQGRTGRRVVTRLGSQALIPPIPATYADRRVVADAIRLAYETR